MSNPEENFEKSFNADGITKDELYLARVRLMEGFIEESKLHGWNKETLQKVVNRQLGFADCFLLFDKLRDLNDFYFQCFLKDKVNLQKDSGITDTIIKGIAGYINNIDEQTLSVLGKCLFRSLETIYTPELIYKVADNIWQVAEQDKPFDLSFSHYTKRAMTTEIFLEVLFLRYLKKDIDVMEQTSKKVNRWLKVIGFFKKPNSK